MGNFYTDVIQKDPRFVSVDRIADPTLLEPVTREAVEDIIAELAGKGQHFMLFETYRSQARQTALFVKKRTKLATVGCHHYGLAADLVRVVNGQPSWDGDFSVLLEEAKAHNLISGLDWGDPGVKHTIVDGPHVQRITLGRQRSVFSGQWYPSVLYNPYADG